MVAICTVAAIGFLVGFAFAADVDPDSEELVEMACGGDDYILSMAAAKNLAYRLEPEFAEKVAGRYVENWIASQSTDTMRKCYKSAYNEGNEQERVKALNCMALVPGKDTAGFIEAALKKDKSAEVRKAAVVCLGKVGGADNIPALLEVIKSPEEDSAVVDESSKALSAFG